MNEEMNPVVGRFFDSEYVNSKLRSFSIKLASYLVLLLSLFIIIGIFDINAHYLMGKFVYHSLKPLFGSIGIIIIPPSLMVLSIGLILERRYRLLNAIAQYSLLLCIIILPLINLIMHIRLGTFFHPDDNQSVGVVGASLGRAFETLFGPRGGIVALGLFAIVVLPPISGYAPSEIICSVMRIFGLAKSRMFRRSLRGYESGLSEAGTGLVDTNPADGVPTSLVSVVSKRLSDKKKYKNESNIPEFDDFSNKPVSQMELNFHRMLRERGEYHFPPIELLNPPGATLAEDDKRDLAMLIEKTLENYGVEAKVEGMVVGPVIIRCELRPAQGVRVNAVRSLKSELAMALAARSLRIEAPIPGRDVIGIEFPNNIKRIVTLRELLECDEFQRAKSLLTICVGKDLAGMPIVGDLTRMPHLLIAGQTGAGKSVCLNALVISLLYNTAPDEVKIILIDPKRVEMNLYENLPHLLVPVVQEWNDAKNALIWVAKEMTSRLERLKESRCRDIAAFNRKRPNGEFMPFIIIVIDEFATLMDIAPGREVERLINHLARLARASGIHLILATQRPDVKVITGSIKANIPARIAFSVPSQVDSRTILDRSGADLLLGEGDMLYKGPLDSAPKRAQGAYVSDEEIERVVEYLIKQIKPEYKVEIFENQGEVEDLQGIAPLEDYDKTGDDDDDAGDDEEYIEEAMRIARMNKKRISASLLQRELRIGYNRASRIIDLMEKRKLITPWDGQRSRRLIDEDDDGDMMDLDI